MKQRRWEPPKQGNTANPTPNYLKPTNYDIKLFVDHVKLIGYIGPILPRQPTGQVPYDSATVTWRQGKPQDVVTGWNGRNQIKYQYSGPGIWRLQIDWLLGPTIRWTYNWDLKVGVK